ncbi:MAG: Ribose ABC transport system, permease protein RbsC [uncultured Solirubrobacteraceae bacterium]|uniref:Ribose ABC transport system, permease protein RbsC n=1 Tax=uncultured Solirubrobacteraceae bacterium TaxID=1162706 RepID=A0A6J4T859_9ACTN|nr:MAG: Ribose ABC transport system, permease protein RbsC [uncultured Solirubrobacteraceae bacterium]
MADVTVRPGEGAAPAPPSADAERRSDVAGFLRDNGVYVALALLVLGNLLFASNFATGANLRTQLVQVAPVLIVALGMTLVIGTEGIDLSVGSVMALAAAIIPLWLGLGPGPAILIALLVGAAAGAFNGALVAYVGVQPIVATLALFVAGRGLALVLADGQLKQIENEGFLSLGTSEVAGIPILVVIAAALVVLVLFVARRTTFGRHVVAVGGNPTASFLAGLPVRRTLMAVYVISGVLAAVAGVLATARLTASDPSAIGQLIELSAITAVVVGGTPLTGGRVRVIGTVAGALLVQLIDSTLIRNDVPDSLSQIIQALLIVAAVAVQRRAGAAR